MDSFPIEVLEYVYDLSYKIDNTGRSDDKVIIYEDKYVLKISDNKERLLKEKNKIDFLNGKLAVPRSVLFEEYNGKYYYLRTFIVGDSLIANKFLNDPIRLIKILVKCVKLLKSIDKYKIPFNSQENVGNSFVHGDLCLPNIIVDADDNIAGFIDLDNSGLGDPWYDYAWLLWSLEYNLKTDKYNEILLNELEIEFDQQKFEQYIPLEYR